MKQLSLLILCAFLVACGGGGGSNSTGGGLSGNDGNASGDTTESTAPQWSEPRTITTAPSTNAIANYTIASTRTGAAMASWVTHRTDLVGSPYDLFSIRYSPTTDWGSLETYSAVDSSFRLAGIHLLDNGSALMENDSSEVYTYESTRGWSPDTLSTTCCEGRSITGADAPSYSTLATESNDTVITTYTPLRGATKERYGIPFNDSPSQMVSRATVSVEQRPDGTLRAIERVNHSYERAPRPGDPLATFHYSTLREATMSGTNWNTPTEIYRSPDIGSPSRSTYPIDRRDVLVTTSPRGHTIIVWEERYAPNPQSRATDERAVSLRQVGGTWETPTVIAPEIRLHSIRRGVVSIDDNAHALLIIPASFYHTTSSNGAQTLAAYTTKTDGTWNAPQEFTHRLDGRTAYQGRYSLFALPNGTRFFTRRSTVRFRRAGILAQWYVPGRGWSSAQFLHDTAASDAIVDNYRVTLSENGSAFLIAKQGKDFWVTHANAPN